MWRVVLFILPFLNCLKPVYGHPIYTTNVNLKYKVNLSEPCGPGTWNYSIVNAGEHGKLPDMVIVANHVLKAINSVVDDMVKARFPDQHSMLQILSSINLPKTPNLRNKFPNMVQACGEKQDVLALLWQVLLDYVNLISEVKEAELYWVGFETGIARRTPSFEIELTNIEMNDVSTLLCGIKTVAEAEHVHLIESIIEAAINYQSTGISSNFANNKKVELDNLAYIVLNNFKQNFLSFAVEFFSSCYNT